MIFFCSVIQLLGRCQPAALPGAQSSPHNPQAHLSEGTSPYSKMPFGWRTTTVTGLGKRGEHEEEVTFIKRRGIQGNKEFKAYSPNADALKTAKQNTF